MALGNTDATKPKIAPTYNRIGIGSQILKDWASGKFRCWAHQ